MLGKGLATKHYTRKPWSLARHYTYKEMPWCQAFILYIKHCIFCLGMKINLLCLLLCKTSFFSQHDQGDKGASQKFVLGEQ